MKTTVTELHHRNAFSDRICSDAVLGMERDEFFVVYQPKFDVRTLRTVGVEALVRWQLPNGQIVFPAEFIPSLEESGQIEQLDFFVLEKICQMLTHMARNGFVPVPVSVNFSRVHIHTPGFAERLHKTVSAYGVPAELIEIEFTESAFVNDVPPLDHLIEQLHTFGYAVAMDDFGTGVSTLNELMNLKVDVLKLDRAFLRLTSKNEARARCIIHAIVQMANALGITVVAEGIEDADSLAMLRECGCGVGQGYFYSRPISESCYMECLERRCAAI